MTRSGFEDGQKGITKENSSARKDHFDSFRLSSHYIDNYLDSDKLSPSDSELSKIPFE